MKKQLLLLLCLVPMMASAQLGLKVIEQNEAKSLHIPMQYVNANGKVLVTNDYYEELKKSGFESKNLNEINGWPVLGIEGTTQRASRFIDIDLDGEKDIIFATGNTVHAYDSKGDPKPGWPVTAGIDPMQGAPSVANLDEDPELEIVANTNFYGIRGGLYAWDTDGTLLSGFPKTYPDGAPQKEPLLQNMDSDPQMEIIIHVSNFPTSLIYAFNGDGSSVEFWDGVELDYIPGCGCSSGDINGDGVPEIIACSYWKIYAFSLRAELLPGWPFTFEQDVRGVSYSNPVIADIDEDGLKEVVVATCNEQPATDAGAVYVLNGDGTLVNGWPQYVNRWIFAPVTVCDFDQDSHLDILAGDQILSPSPDDYLHAWDRNGNTLSGFPIGDLEAINIQGMVSDFDNNGDFEIIVDNNVTGGKYQIFNHDGTEFDGFTVNPEGATFYNTPLLDDINGDGSLNIIAPTSEFNTFTTDYHIYDTESPYLSEMTPIGHHQYNSRNTGEYGLDDPVSVNETIATEKIEIEVYPNPFTDHINMVLPYGENGASVRIYNSQGVVVFSQDNTTEGLNTLYLPNLAAGVYLYHITLGEQSIGGKLIK